MSREKIRSRLPPAPTKRRIDDVDWSDLRSGKARKVATKRGNQRHNLVKMPITVIGQCSLLEGAQGGPWFVHMGCSGYWWLLGAWAQLLNGSKGTAVHTWLGARDFVTALHGASDADRDKLVETQYAYQDLLIGEGGTMPDLFEYEAYIDGAELLSNGWPTPELAYARAGSIVRTRRAAPRVRRRAPERLDAAAGFCDI